MKFAKPLLIASAMALAFGAYAADDKQAKAEPGFNNLDTNDDGKLTRAEAAKDQRLSAGWAQADRDKDGTLSRSEYLYVKGKQDIGRATDTVKSAVSSDDKAASSGSGSSSSAGATSKAK